MSKRRTLYIDFETGVGTGGYSEFFIELYKIVDERYRHDVRSYLIALKEAVVTNSWDISIFSFIPKENLDIVKECLMADAGVTNENINSISIKYCKKGSTIDSIMNDFHLTLRNDIYKRLCDKVKYGIDFGNISDSNGKTGICELGLPSKVYIWLKGLGFNTVEDLTSICTHKLFSLKGIYVNYFADILTHVHNKGYKFIDEKETDIGLLKKIDSDLLAKKYARHQTIFERKLRKHSK